MVIRVARLRINTDCPAFTAFHLTIGLNDIGAYAAQVFAVHELSDFRVLLLAPYPLDPPLY